MKKTINAIVFLLICMGFFFPFNVSAKITTIIVQTILFLIIEKPINQKATKVIGHFIKMLECGKTML